MIILWLILASLARFSSPLFLPLTADNIVDLTHDFAENFTIAWPTASQYKFTQLHRGPTDGGYWYEANDFAQAEHCGTHTDAPSHFSEGKWRTDEIPLERLTGPGVVIDITAKTKVSKDVQLEVDDILKWEAKHGQIPYGAVVIMYSGTGTYYGDKTRYLGWPEGIAENNPQDTQNLHFPGFSPEAAKWLTENRNIFGTGVDTASVDFGQSKDFKTHQIFASNNIWGLENLNNVDKLPSKDFTVINMVTKLRGGSGGPSRVIAILDSKSTSGTSSLASSSLVSSLLMTFITFQF